MTPEMTDALYLAGARLERAEHVIARQQGLLDRIPKDSDTYAVARDLLDQFVILQSYHRTFLLSAIAKARRLDAHGYSDSSPGAPAVDLGSWSLIQELNLLTGVAHQLR